MTTSGTFQIENWHIYVVFGIVLVMGAARLLQQLWRTAIELEFANDFREKFIAYCNSQGEDNDAFNWLIRNSNRMQSDMGVYGIYRSYTPPSANYAYSNYPIILNMLPELRNNIERSFEGLLHRGIINRFMRAIDEALLHYIGVLEDRFPRQRKRLFNPFLWLREGVGLILSVPLLLLSWFGLMGTVTLGRVQASTPFKMLSALGGLVGLIASIMTIALGWHDAFQLLKHLRDAL